MTKSVAIIQARMLSTRLRGKSLISVAGKPLMVRVIERIKAMSFIDEIRIATTPDVADDPIVAVAQNMNIKCVRGDRSDLLGRFIQASADVNNKSCIVRFTADNPLYDPSKSTQAYQEHIKEKADYTHIDGLSHMVPEFINVDALRRLGELVDDPFDREHVTPYLRKHPEEFQIHKLPADFAGLRPELDHHLTIDNQQDLEMFEHMLEDIEKPNQFVRLEDCYVWIDNNKAGLRGIISHSPDERRMKIAGREVGDGCPCFIVAEIGQNHNGQIGMAKRLIDMAARCEVDAVKFQKRDIKWELTEDAYNKPYDNPNSFGTTYGEHREFLELSEEQHKELREYALARGVTYFCTAC
ncbi:MAG: cytidylyltransferase domain-containing protein, partial [Planctomycetota bacterium]